jgi:hypothetical protein
MLTLDGFIGQCKIIMSMVSSDKNVNCQEMSNRREMRVKEHTLQGFLPEAGNRSGMIHLGARKTTLMMKVSLLLRPWDMAQSLWHFTLTEKDILDHVLDSSEILHELIETLLIKQAAENKIQTF